MTVRTVWIGIGCCRNTSSTTIQAAIAQVLTEYQLFGTTIMGIATLDRKSDEVGLLEYCRDHSLPLRYFSAAQLNLISVPNPSIRVAAMTETPSVAEAAAMCAAGTQSLIVPKRVLQGVTIAIAENSLS